MAKKWVAHLDRPERMDFTIQSGGPAGYYIYINVNGVNKYDYLQDTLEQTKSFAFRKFQVPLDAWTEVDE